MRQYFENWSWWFLSFELLYSCFCFLFCICKCSIQIIKQLKINLTKKNTQKKHTWSFNDCSEEFWTNSQKTDYSLTLQVGRFLIVIKYLATERRTEMERRKWELSEFWTQRLKTFSCFFFMCTQCHSYAVS